MEHGGAELVLHVYIRTASVSQELQDFKAPMVRTKVDRSESFIGRFIDPVHENAFSFLERLVLVRPHVVLEGVVVEHLQALVRVLVAGEGQSGEHFDVMHFRHVHIASFLQKQTSEFGGVTGLYVAEDNLSEGVLRVHDVAWDHLHRLGRVVIG